MSTRLRPRFVVGSLSILVFVLAFIFLKIGTTADHPKLNRTRSGAMEAMDFWTRSRAYPDSDIPKDKYARAYQHAKTKIRRLPETMSSAIWEPIGPNNLAGRSLSVAINPQNSNTILLGTASGGLWRSYTAGLGADWHQVTLGHPALGVSSIVYHPTDSNTIYIGTGEVYGTLKAFGGLVVRTTRGSYGIGILKTTDGGETWTKSLDWTYNQQTGVQKLAMNPLNPNTIYASTTEGIYKTTDAGASWFDASLIPFISHDIIVHPTDTAKVLATFGNLSNPTIFFLRSVDGGSTWTTVSGIPEQNGKAHLGMSASNPDIVYATVPDSTTGIGSLWKTTNFGINWTELVNTPGIWGVQGWYSHYVAVHPTDPDVIIFNSVGSSKSTNGGSTFTFPGGNYSDNHGFAIDPNNPNIFYTANDDGIYRSTDFGSTYTSVGLGLQTGQFYAGFSNSATDSLLSTVQSQDHIPGYIFQGSLGWGRSALDEAGWTAIDPTNDNVIYAVNRFGGSMYKSTDRGANFSFRKSFGSIGAWNSPFVLAPSNTQVIYFADTRVHKSTTGATSWTITNGGAAIDGGNKALSLAVSYTNPDTAYVGFAPFVNNAGVFRTVNGGTSWTEVTGTLPDRYPLDLAVDPTNSRIVYAAMGGFGSGHLFKSTNSGGSWTDITGTLPDAQTTAIAIDPLNTNIVYVGNDIGVYVSTNGGSTWSDFSQGLPDAVIVSDLVISPSDRTLRIGTHGNGAFRRKLVGELPANYFDYRSFALITPVPEAIMVLDTTISSIRASFRSLSAVEQPDSFDVQYRILKYSTVLYSSTKRLAPLALGESRQVTFTGGYTFADTGTFTLEAIVLGSDMNAANDTLRGTVTIVTPPTIATYTVEKSNCPYTEIVGGSPGPVGDDAQSIAPLPFPFVYDGQAYDSIQISTNGWVELGTGTRGSFYGLSNGSQLGGFFRMALGDGQRPSKALGIWWTDMSTTATSPASAITYKTEGSAPDRVFVVQWKNVLAYFDEGQSTLRLNMQMRFYETTNVFEFHYGPKVPGTLNAYSGAAIGYKDVLGGDNRYFDLFRMSSGLSGDLATYLSPSVGWPGQDSCFRMTPAAAGNIFVNYDNGWNLFSMPVQLTDPTANAVFPGRRIYEFAGGYREITEAESLEVGKGYWVKIPAAALKIYNGGDVNSLVVPVTPGWNLVGSIDHTTTAPSGGVLSTNFFGFADGYSVASQIEPGNGYWVKASGAGSFTLGPTVTKQSVADEVASYSRLTIADGSRNKQTLYLGKQSEDGSVNVSRYELPPVMPNNSFDVRYTSGRMLELLPNGAASEVRYPISVQARYPLTISFESVGGMTAFLDEMVDGKVKKSHVLSAGSTVTLTNPDASISVRVTSGVGTTPKEFALHQNYPNPFNPSTEIRFDLPVKSEVSLKIFDILGREVMTLAEGEMEAGVHSVKANFSTYSSGIYFYRLKAGDFMEAKKLLLTK